MRIFSNVFKISTMDGVRMIKLWMLSALLTVNFTSSEKQNGDFSNTPTYIHDGEEISPEINPFRNTYKKDVNRVWVLSEEMGVWALVFHSMSIEDSPRCQHDYLEIKEIYDGVNKTNHNDMTAERYCGSDVPGPYISQRPHVEVRFCTDSLWEMKGFHIKAIHGLNRDILLDKVNKYTGVHPRDLLMGSNNEKQDSSAASKEGTIFYILIASAAVALLIFGTLLTYFIITMRRVNDRGEREPELSFIPNNHRSQSKNRNHVITKKSKKKPFIDIENSGKRYTRGKLSTMTSSTVRQPVKEHSTDMGTHSHHNNLYVSNFQFSPK